jgi:hypothetical protein
MRSRIGHARVWILGALGLALAMATLATGALSPSGAALAAPAAGTRWHTLEVAQEPGNFGLESMAYFDTVSCAAGYCVAGGRDNDIRAVLATRADGSWSVATRVPLPSQETTGTTAVTGVACSGRGDCTAVGDDAGNQSFVLTETDGTWSAPAQVVPPASSARSAGLSLGAVSCTTGGNCAAVGAYYRYRQGSNSLPIVATQAAGTWQRSALIELPAGAATGRRAAALLDSVSCQRDGACVAVGGYRTRSGLSLPMVAVESGGRWGRAQGLAAPANMSAFQGQSWAGLGSVSCTGGFCLAVGAYSTAAGMRPLAVTRSRGRWGQASAVTAVLPRDAGLLEIMGSVSCTRSFCLALGFTTGSARDAYALTYSRSRWGQAARIVAPGRIGTLQQVSCSGSGACTAAGSNTTRRGVAELMVASRS